MALHEFDSITEAESFFNEFQQESKSGWRVCCSCTHIGTTDSIKKLKKGKLRILWTLRKQKGISFRFDGIPFIFIGSKDWNCHRGKDLDKKKKERKKAERIRREIETNMILHRRRCQISKKVDCLAMAYMTHIVKFPMYKISKNRERARKKISIQLKKDLLEEKPVYGEHKFLLQLPDRHEHNGHPTYEMRPELQNRFFPSMNEAEDKGDKFYYGKYSDELHISGHYTQPGEGENFTVEITGDLRASKWKEEFFRLLQEKVDVSVYREKCAVTSKAILQTLENVDDLDTLIELHHNLNDLYEDLTLKFQIEQKQSIIEPNNS